MGNKFAKGNPVKVTDALTEYCNADKAHFTPSKTYSVTRTPGALTAVKNLRKAVDKLCKCDVSESILEKHNLSATESLTVIGEDTLKTEAGFTFFLLKLPLFQLTLERCFVSEGKGMYKLQSLTLVDIALGVPDADVALSNIVDAIVAPKGTLDSIIEDLHQRRSSRRRRRMLTRARRSKIARVESRL